MFMDSGQPPSKSAVADLAITQSISGEPEIDGFRNDAGEFFRRLLEQTDPVSRVRANCGLTPQILAFDL